MHVGFAVLPPAALGHVLVAILTIEQRLDLRFENRQLGVVIAEVRRWDRHRVSGARLMAVSGWSMAAYCMEDA